MSGVRAQVFRSETCIEESQAGPQPYCWCLIVRRAHAQRSSPLPDCKSDRFLAVAAYSRLKIHQASASVRLREVQTVIYVSTCPHITAATLIGRPTTLITDTGAECS